MDSFERITMYHECDTDGLKHECDFPSTFEAGMIRPYRYMRWATWPCGDYYKFIYEIDPRPTQKCDKLLTYVNDILYNRNAYYKDMLYTGISYDSSLGFNKEDVGIKIHVEINCSLNHRYCGKIQKDENNIYFTLNRQKDNIALKSYLLHNFIDIIDSSDKNNYKNILLEFDEEFNMEKLFAVEPDTYKNVLSNLMKNFYIFTPDAQDIFVKNISMYMKLLSSDDVRNTIANMYYNFKYHHILVYHLQNPVSKEYQVYNLLASLRQELRYINRFIEFSNLFDLYRKQYQDICLFVGYYLKKYGLYESDSKYITYEFLTDYMYSLYEYNYDIQEEITNISNCIENIYKSFKQRIFDIAYNIMSENNMFITEDIADKYIINYKWYQEQEHYDVTAEHSGNDEYKE